MSVNPWFSRTFNFNQGAEQFASLYKRLGSAAQRYEQTVSSVAEKVLCAKPENKWSVKEHIGHLTLLEDLWLLRFQDISESRLPCHQLT